MLFRVVRHLLQVLRRKVARVRDRSQYWHKGRLHPPDVGPVHTVEERVRHDLVHTVSPQTHLGRTDQTADQIFGVRRQVHIFWEIKLVAPVHNLAVRLVCILAAERWVPNKALKHDSAQGPPVTLLSVALLQKDLGCNVIRCAYSRVSLRTRKRLLTVTS